MYVCIDLLLERLRSDDLMWELRRDFSSQMVIFLYTVESTLDAIAHYPAVTGLDNFRVTFLFLCIIALAGSTWSVVKKFRNVLRKLKSECEGLTSPSCHAESFGEMPR